MLVCEVDAQDIAHARKAQSELDRGTWGDVIVVDASQDDIGRGLFDEPDRASRCAIDAVRIDESFVAVRTLGMKPEAFRRLAHARRIKRCNLQYNRCRRFADFCIGSAHYTGNGNGFCSIGDDDVVGG